MSQKQMVAEMRQKLERWRSHNEVYAKPADRILYEFLNDFLKLLEDHEEKIKQDIVVLEQPIKDPENEINTEFAPQSDEEGEGGGDTPPAPDTP